MFHKVMDSAGSTSQMPLQAGAHESPANSWPIRDGNVRILYTKHALLNEIKNLAVERQLKPVTYVAWESFAQPDRLLTDGRVKGPITASDVFAPPTTSTRGITCGGLKG